MGAVVALCAQASRCLDRQGPHDHRRRIQRHTDGFSQCVRERGGETNWYVLHAEANAITKLARSNNSAVGATLYITMSPCRECAKLIHQAGISRVVYRDEYKDPQGLEFLKQAGVELVHLDQRRKLRSY